MNATLCRLAVVMLITGAAPGLALAQQKPTVEAIARAKDLRQQGHKHFDEQRYPEALAAYQKSYELSADPALLYNIGRAYQLLNQAPEALDAFEAFLAKASPELRSRVQGLDETVAEARKKVTTLTLSSSVAGARVLLRKKQVGVTPLKPLRVLAGEADIEVIAEGYEPLVRKLSLKGGEAASVELTLTSKKNSGLLVVRSTAPGARALVDGRPIGNTPTEVALEAGEHRVTLQGDGLKETSKTVVLGAGERREVTMEAEKSARPSRWWLWAGAGLLIAGGVALTVALTTERAADKGTATPGQVSAPLLRF